MQSYSAEKTEEEEIFIKRGYAWDMHIKRFVLSHFKKIVIGIYGSWRTFNYALLK